MRVIGGGFGRTGTMSLKVALQQLGFAPCLHMIDLLSGNPELSETFIEAYRGKSVDWRTVLEGWEATVDWPGCSFYRQLMETFPEAPVILSVRDPESWYQSVNDTIFMAAEVMKDQPEIRDLPASRMLRTIVWDGDFQGQFADKQRTLEVYENHNREVKEFVPPERLLVFEVKQGWGPLCRFLRVETPETPFPHVNDKESFLAMIQSGAHMSGEQTQKLNTD